MAETSKKQGTVSGLSCEDFKALIDGKETNLYVLTNKNGMEVCITNFGGIVVSILVPDAKGNMRDVVLGHNTITEYQNSPEKYLGAAIGRYGNRIKKGTFSLHGKTYNIPSNNADCSLHGGLVGYNNKVWDAEQINSQTLDLTYISPDGEEGFPGTLTLKLTYQLTDQNELKIGYEAETDKATVLNLTHHSFFNLNGEGSTEITDNTLTIHADFFTPMDDKSVPTGEIRSVKNTPMDFCTPQTIGARIDDYSYDQLKFGIGYDHNYVLSKNFPGELSLAAQITAPTTGITMEVFTTEPGMQLYTGNWLNGFEGKKGHHYPARTAVCFETQHFPDSPNNPHFPTTVLDPGQKYTQICIYKFGTNK